MPYATSARHAIEKGALSLIFQLIAGPIDEGAVDIMTWVRGANGGDTRNGLCHSGFQ